MTGAEWPEQLRRLDQFRALHPAVVIDRTDGFGFWQAWIPAEGSGGTVITRYLLHDLLNQLDELHAPPASDDVAAHPDRASSQGSAQR